MSSIVNFTFNGAITKIQCLANQTMKDICNNFASKIGINLNKLQLLYNGNQVKYELTFNEYISLIDRDRNEMNILVYEIISTIINENDNLIKSKEIICPQCLESCRIKFNDYKIALYGCKNGHQINNILLDEFYNTQKINELNIICDNCKNIN